MDSLQIQEEQALLTDRGDDLVLQQKGMDPAAMEEAQTMGYFKAGLVTSQVLGVACVVLVGVWTGRHLGGFAWQSDPKLQFNYHPLFMVLGLIVCYADAILVYRAFRYQRKRSVKLAHGALHSLAFIFAVVALKAVFDSHNLAPQPIPNLYSLHSWIGLMAIILFSLQLVCGFVAFLFPGLAKVWRARYLPLHVFFGVLIFLLCVTAALTGIVEKLVFTLGKTYKDNSPLAVVGNLLGFCILLFAGVVVFLVTNSSYRRRMLPEEVQLQMDMDQPSPTN